MSSKRVCDLNFFKIRLRKVRIKIEIISILLRIKTAFQLILIQKKFANFGTKVQLNHKNGYCFQF